MSEALLEFSLPDGWSEDEHGNPVPTSMPSLVDSSDEEERLTAMHRRLTAYLEN